MYWSTKFMKSVQHVVRNYTRGIGEAKVALESSGFCLPWVEFFEELGFEVFVAHPAKVKVIAEARIKTDKIDSEALAHLLRLGYLPCSYIPSREIRGLRNLARHRVKLGRVRKDFKNRPRSALSKRGIELDFNPFTLAGREELRELGIPEIVDHLEVMECVEARMLRVEEEISRELKAYPSGELLTSIPGIELHRLAHPLRAEGCEAFP
jgi:transposase